MSMKPRLAMEHWRREDHVQRMTTQNWKQILLQHDDRIVYKGNIRYLQAVKIGYGVVEVSKTPLERN